jgi:hypothetical protein
MQRAVSALTTNFGKLTGASASADLPRQWLIAEDVRLVPAGWQSMRFGNFHIAWNALLPRTRLPGNAAAMSGVILGWYIGSDGVLLGEVKQPSTRLEVAAPHHPGQMRELDDLLDVLVGDSAPADDRHLVGHPARSMVSVPGGHRECRVGAQNLAKAMSCGYGDLRRVNCCGHSVDYRRMTSNSTPHSSQPTIRLSM